MLQGLLGKLGFDQVNVVFTDARAVDRLTGSPL